jgi:hypothetical protein
MVKLVQIDHVLRRMRELELGLRISSNVMTSQHFQVLYVILEFDKVKRLHDFALTFIVENRQFVLDRFHFLKVEK